MDDPGSPASSIDDGPLDSELLLSQSTSDCRFCWSDTATRIQHPVPDFLPPHNYYTHSSQDVLHTRVSCRACGRIDNYLDFAASRRPHGVKWTFVYKKDQQDNTPGQPHNLHNLHQLQRQILKSRSVKIELPELEFEMAEGSLGSKVLTIQQLLREIIIDVRENTAMMGYDDVQKQALESFYHTLEQYAMGAVDFSLVLTDAAGLSVVSQAPPSGQTNGTDTSSHHDPFLKYEHFERSQDENEFLDRIGQRIILD